MIYNKPLPELKNLCKIVRGVESFPATTERVVADARSSVLPRLGG